MAIIFFFFSCVKVLHLRHCYLQIVISESISVEVLRIGSPRGRHCCLGSLPSNAFTLYMKFLKCPKNFAMSRCNLCSCADPVVIASLFFFFLFPLEFVTICMFSAVGHICPPSIFAQATSGLARGSVYLFWLCCVSQF